MSNASRSTSDWTLTGEAFTKFLARLDPDNERAAELYEALRLRLEKFFDWRGAHFPEECVDRTFDRVTRKIDSGEIINDISSYCHGVARIVLLETLRHPEHKKVSLEALTESELANPSPEQTSLRRQCFDKCLSNLPAENRQLILEYYKDERREKIENRQSLAEKLEIPLDALRSRAQRIRNKLEKCVGSCIKRRP